MCIYNNELNSGDYYSMANEVMWRVYYACTVSRTLLYFFFIACT